VTTEGEDFESALAARYAGKDMATLFAPLERARAWRDAWIALAEAEHELGAPVSRAQVDALRATRDRIDLGRIEAIEAETRHDVMAHVRAWSEVCPVGAPIIHLGATSAFVTDNAEAILARRALGLVRARLVHLVRALADFARREADRPCLGYTHFQPAQPVTVGKRAALWLQDVVLDLEDVEERLRTFPCRGVKGTTGTQASFFEMLGDEAKVQELDRRVARKLGFERAVALSGQTAPRKLDARLADALAGLATTLGKLGLDLRLLAHTGEVREAFGKGQVGSSAMPYKRNPMKAERLCSLARLLPRLRDVVTETATQQWLERSLDDSAARRVAIPDLFLAADGALRAAVDLARGLEVDAEVVRARLAAEAPFFAVEKVLVRGVAAGGDRQALHEALRVHAIAARAAGDPGEAFRAALASDPTFAALKGELDALTDPAGLVGLAPQQVRRYLAEVVDPLLAARLDVPGFGDPLRV
jgi:adenylosuccinate lyase